MVCSRRDLDSHLASCAYGVLLLAKRERDALGSRTPYREGGGGGGGDSDLSCEAKATEGRGGQEVEGDDAGIQV